MTHRTVFNRIFKTRHNGYLNHHRCRAQIGADIASPYTYLGQLIRYATACALMLLCTSAALAKDYIVEAIVFENMSPSNVTEPHAYQAPKKPKTRAQAWLLETQLLNNQADKIDADGNYELKHHFAWGQESLPYSQSATYTVVETDTQGYIKIYAEQLLFANIDIDYKGFRMVEKRRLKLNEKHYFDHPKFGLLLQVSRLKKETLPDNEQTGVADGE